MCFYAKLAEYNELVTHSVQKYLETRENEQNVVLNESSEALGNRSEIVRILVLAMTTAELLFVFRCFTNKMVVWGFAKSKAIKFSFTDYFDRLFWFR